MTPEVGLLTSPKHGFENIPTLVAMADVYINSDGYVWNEKVSPEGELPILSLLPTFIFIQWYTVQSLKSGKGFNVCLTAFSLSAVKQIYVFDAMILFIAPFVSGASTSPP